MFNSEAAYLAGSSLLRTKTSRSCFLPSVCRVKCYRQKVGSGESNSKFCWCTCALKRLGSVCFRIRYSILGLAKLFFTATVFGRGWILLCIEIVHQNPLFQKRSSEGLSHCRVPLRPPEFFCPRICLSVEHKREKNVFRKSFILNPQHASCSTRWSAFSISSNG